MGMVASMLVWIFSASVLLLLWMMRICGAVCTVMVRESCKSCNRRSKRLICSERSRTCCASMRSPDASACALRRGSSTVRASSNLRLPASMYAVNSAWNRALCS